ncbi:hypothetical protein MMC24_003834 [Lignoscripta atroalba]|nr:hypothetical protein [Lignoscripta atroalba]
MSIQPSSLPLVATTPLPRAPTPTETAKALEDGVVLPAEPYVHKFQESPVSQAICYPNFVEEGMARSTPCTSTVGFLRYLLAALVKHIRLKDRFNGYEGKVELIALLDDLKRKGKTIIKQIYDMAPEVTTEQQTRFFEQEQDLTKELFSTHPEAFSICLEANNKFLYHLESRTRVAVDAILLESRQRLHEEIITEAEDEYIDLRIPASRLGAESKELDDYADLEQRKAKLLQRLRSQLEEVKGLIQERDRPAKIWTKPWKQVSNAPRGLQRVNIKGAVRRPLKRRSRFEPASVARWSELWPVRTFKADM